MSKRSMEKIWAPADKVLCEIGRFVLVRPRISGLLLITAVIITILSNNLWPLSASMNSDDSAPDAMTLTIADDTDMPQNPTPVLASTVDSAEQDSSTVKTDSAALAQAVANSPVEDEDNNWQTATVRKGDNLARIFKRNHLSAADLDKIASLPAVKKAAQGLQPGQEIRFQTNNQGELDQLVLVTNNNSITVNTSGSGFKTDSSIAATKTPDIAARNSTSSPALTLSQKTSPVKIAAQSNKNDSGLTYVSGEIQHSLSKDARKAGLSVKQAQQLAQIFSVRGITQKLKVGDEFSVLFGDSTTSKKKQGNILAAQLTHAGANYQLIRFTSPDGYTDYYNPQGQSSQPGLVRAPLNYHHISSQFSYRRFDPVLHIVHAHLGVDYAAATGTPVKAAGDGVITSAAYRGGYGRSVIIQHDVKYSTLYAHLSRFAANLKTGSRVKQGEVIGYVGQSGFATGPHLHYEIHLNNVPNNPLTVALPGKQVPAAYRKQFLAQTKILLAQLKSNRQIQLAENSVSEKKS